MNQQKQLSLIQRTGRCIVSLYQSIQQAGGMPANDLLDMTLKSFIIDIAGPNNILFKYEKADEKE